MPYELSVATAELLDPVITQFLITTLSAPSSPIVELLLTLIHAYATVEVTEITLRFLRPGVEGSSPSIVTLSAPANSIIALPAVGEAGELIVTSPLGLNKTEVYEDGEELFNNAVGVEGSVVFELIVIVIAPL